MKTIVTESRDAPEQVASLVLAVGDLSLGEFLALAPAAGAAARDALRRGSWQPLHRFVEIPVLAAALVMLPTLVGFVVYFVGWHSVRHTLTWIVRLEPSNPKRGFMRFARLALPLTAATAIKSAACMSTGSESMM